MFSYNNYLNQNYYNCAYNQEPSKPVDASPVDKVDADNDIQKNKLSFHKNTIKDVPFNPAFCASQLRTQLTSSDEMNKYNQVQQSVDKHTRKKLDSLLKSGILLNSSSNNNSTVLDNLYNILSTPRAEGLNAQSLVKDVVDTLDNPYLITQQFGNIPTIMKEEALDKYMTSTNRNKSDNNAKIVSMNDINITHSGTCVAASIEFNLAQAQPAEFARFAEGLSSPKNQVEKTIHLDKLADNSLDAIWLLNAFEIPHKESDFKTSNLTFKPDENALVRAKIQTIDKDAGERTPVDVLMQSTFMQVGSQQAYNALSDKRAGKFNQNEKGLIEFEKTFVESIVEDKNKISVTYQNVDENARLVGYETDMATLKKHITDSINMGENVILGYTQTDNDNIIINGHEITIVGYKTDNKTGKMTFICNDTDDNLSKPIEYTEDYLLPKIHHAALPKEVVEHDVELVENWVEGLKNYKEMKKEQEANNAQQIKTAA